MDLLFELCIKAGEGTALLAALAFLNNKIEGVKKDVHIQLNNGIKDELSGIRADVSGLQGYLKGKEGFVRLTRAHP